MAKKIETTSYELKLGQWEFSLLEAALIHYFETHKNKMDEKERDMYTTLIKELES